MTALNSLFDFIFDYCACQGASCPLVLVFLLCRLHLSGAQSVYHSTLRKIKLFLERLDAIGFKSLINQFPALKSEGNDTFCKHSTPSYMLTVMQEMYDDQRFICNPNENVYFKSFHTSNIWIIQQDFYQHSMLQAWDSVPFQISSNTFVAHQYVTEVEKIIHAAFKNNELSQKSVCFVEIGAGHGILSYLLAKELRARHLKGVVICTDFHDTVFVQLLQLPWVRELCASGHLDFAVCGAAASSTPSVSGDKSRPAGLQLLYKGCTTLESTVGGQVDSPLLVVVGNYAFDSFPTELIVGTDGGELYQIGVHEVCAARDASCSSLAPSPKRRVKDLLKHLCMRQICPFCASPFASPPEISRNSCLSCDALLANSAAGARKEPAPGDHSLLCRLLRHMADVFAHENGVESADRTPGMIRLPTGVYAVPVSATLMLQRIVESFNDVHEVVLLVGDCFVNHDDARWQSDEFEIFAKNLKPSFPAGRGEDDLVWSLPFCDPPLVSPHDSALAVPVSVHGLWAAFVEVTGHQPSEVLSTSLHMSDFSVLKFRGSAAAPCTSIIPNDDFPTKDDIVNLEFTLFEDFAININDFSTLRQLLVDNKEVGSSVPLAAMEELLRYSQHDMSTFLNLRWLLFNGMSQDRSAFCEVAGDNAPTRKRRKVDRGEKIAADGEDSERLLQLSVQCFDNHYCMSWTEYICSMNQINQWLLALSTKQALKTCLLNIQTKDNSDMNQSIMDYFLEYFAPLSANQMIGKPIISSRLELISEEVYALQLQITSCGQVSGPSIAVHFSLCSWQDAVFVAVCLEKLLGSRQLSSLVAAHVWDALQLNRDKYFDNHSPGIFMRSKGDCSPAGDAAPAPAAKKQSVKRYAHLQNRLKKLR